MSAEKKIQTVTASARNLHISARKCRLVTNAVKRTYALDALARLPFLEKKASPMVAKVIASAVANAENNFQLKPQELFIETITCDMGMVSPRYFPRARGSAAIIRRKLCHINVTLTVRAGKKGLHQIAKKAKDETKKASPAAEANAGSIVDVAAKERKAPRSSEEKKLSTAANKRRMFNRKTGV
jgi:large subunit ribosomal protein L22